MEAGAKYMQEAEGEQQLPRHLEMAVGAGKMTREEALGFAAKPTIANAGTPEQKELPRHLQTAVDNGRMTIEQALKYVAN